MDQGKSRRSFAGNLGAHSRFTVNLARTCLAAACLAECHIRAPGGPLPHTIELALFTAYLGWSLACPWIGHLSWKTDVRIWPFVLFFDWLLCASILLLFEAYVLPVLLFSVLLLSAFHARSGLFVTLLAGIGLSLAFALRGFVGPIEAPLPPYALPSLILSSATLLIAGSVAIWFASSRIQHTALKSWGDELLLVGGNFKTLPIEFLLEKLREFFRADQIAFLWRESEEDDVHVTLHEAGGSIVSTLPNGAQQLLDPEICDGSFMFDPEAQAILCMGRRGQPLIVEARPLTEAIARNFVARRGQSFPVKIGEITARVYIAGRQSISEDALRETERAGELTEAVFERYLFLRAWRDRSFVEARHSLSRDLHDSILQTLAALRMQIAAILQEPDDTSNGAAQTRLKDMQDVIVAEQTRLRQVLDESYRASTERTNLSGLLEGCAASLSRQWGIECRFCAAEEDIVVDSNTAVELEFLVREAVANAAQHAKAKRIALVVAVNEGSLFISLRNDSLQRRARSGNGQTQPRIDLDSRSLMRRLTTLGGSAYSEDISSGSLLAMRIPLGRG